MTFGTTLVCKSHSLAESQSTTVYTSPGRIGNVSQNSASLYIFRTPMTSETNLSDKGITYSGIRLCVTWYAVSDVSKDSSSFVYNGLNTIKDYIIEDLTSQILRNVRFSQRYSWKLRYSAIWSWCTVLAFSEAPSHNHCCLGKSVILNILSVCLYP